MRFSDSGVFLIRPWGPSYNTLTGESIDISLTICKFNQIFASKSELLNRSLVDHLPDDSEVFEADQSNSSTISACRMRPFRDLSSI